MHQKWGNGWDVAHDRAVGHAEDFALIFNK
jgi:hypothetical protein